MGVPARALSLAKMRKEYSTRDELKEGVPSDPYALFGTWLDDACAANVIEPNAMCLSTVSPKTMMPSSRMVLLKDYDQEGFVWYTNYTSRKAREIEENNKASICFWWGDLERSCRIEGEVSKVSSETSDVYFAKRPRGSQIGAWASDQSSPIPSEESMESKFDRTVKGFEDKEIIPRPEHWGGYVLRPLRFEFWKGKESRLHERVVFIKKDDQWVREWLQP